MSIAKKAVSASLWMTSGSYFGFAFNFIVQLLLVRILRPEDFGVFALGLSIAEILFIFFSFSFSMAVIQIHDAKDLLDTAFYLSLISGFIIFAVGVIICLLIAPHYPFQSVIAFLCLCAIQPLQGCSAIYSAAMEKELNFKRNTIVRAVSSHLSGIGAIIFAYLGFGVWSLVIREVITAVLLFLGMRLISTFQFTRRFNADTARKLIVFGYKMLFSRGMEIVYQRIPNFFIGTFAGTRILGLFSQTYYLANLPNAMLSPFYLNVAYATYSKIKEDKPKLNKAYYITNFFSIRLLFPIMLVLLLFPREILNILYGSKWLEAAPMLRFFAVFMAVLPLFHNGKSFLYGMGKMVTVSKIYLVEAAALAFILILGFSWHRPEWFALGYSFSIMLGIFCITLVLKKSRLVLSLRKLFLVPIGVMAVFLFIYPYIVNKVGLILFNTKSSSIVFLVFTITIYVLCEMLLEYHTVRETFKYIWKIISKVQE